MNTLNLIQTKLIAPKGQFNAFGKYKYRSCEDILEALKPLLKETESTLIISDEIVMVGNRFYVKATATLKTKDGDFSATAFAREAETKKGMDDSQITGASSSYARKYALNGLFCIDDTKDADTTSPDGNGHITEQQLHALRDSLISLNASEEKFLKYLNIEKLELLPRDDFQKAMSAIMAKKEKAHETPRT